MMRALNSITDKPDWEKKVRLPLYLFFLMRITDITFRSLMKKSLPNGAKKSWTAERILLPI